MTAAGDGALLAAAAERLPDEPGPDELASAVLSLQRCSRCGYVRFPAAPCCPECLSREFELQDDLGLGTVWSYCVYHRAFDRAFEAALPYNVALVELDAGPRLISNVLGVALDELHVGMRVAAQPREVRRGRFLLYFGAGGGEGGGLSATDVTGAVVRTALGCSLDDLPAGAVEVAKRSVLDVLACAVAGSVDQSSRLATGFAHETGGGNGSVIVGTALRAPPPLAALANGTASHALDFDDVSMRMIHPSATLVPALLAVGESRRMSGRALLEGYVAGFEVEARLCRELNPEHYERGWHTTGSVGPLGAALAVCRALRIDEGRSRHALGIAASSSSSIRRNFGSMVKPLHAGQAAFHGLQAALLAERGFTASTDVVAGENGFLDVFSELERLAAVGAAFAPGAPSELVESGIALKRFACCGAIHSAQDAVLDLLAEPGVTAEDVVGVECRVNRLVPRILVHHVTQDGLEGKFSMEYSLAVCLADGRAGLAQYSDERAGDPALVPLMERVTVVVDESLPVNLAYFPSVVTLELADGSSRTARVDVPEGYPEKPLCDEELWSKVRDCCAPVLDAGRTDELVATVLSLEELDDVGRLAELLVAGDSGWASGS